MKQAKRRWLGSVAFGLAAATGVASAGASPPDSVMQPFRADDGRLYRPVVTEHVVRPGNTLRRISLEFYGTPSRWREIAASNPQVPDPDVIRLGDVIYVVTGREPYAPPPAPKPAPKPPPPPAVVEEEQAVISRVVNEVEKNRQVTQWQRAGIGDEVFSRDGVRTREASSALLSFSSGARLVLNEFSQVVLNAERTASGVTREQIEIEQGQADLSIAREGASEFSVEVGGATARPRRGASGKVETRARLADGGRSQWMVYAGVSALESGGVVVDVPSGMGTSAREGEAPAPPEKLLAAPTLRAPAAGARHRGGAVTLAWEQLAGAAIHRVQLCRDPDCLDVAFSRDVGDAAETRTADLPPGEYSWRVRGISASGLDGFVSAPRSLVIDEAHWLTPLVALIAGLGLLVLLWLVARWRRRRTQRRLAERLTMPVAEQQTVDLTDG